MPCHLYKTASWGASHVEFHAHMLPTPRTHMHTPPTPNQLDATSRCLPPNNDGGPIKTILKPASSLRSDPSWCSSMRTSTAVSPAQPATFGHVELITLAGRRFPQLWAFSLGRLLRRFGGLRGTPVSRLWIHSCRSNLHTTATMHPHHCRRSACSP